MVENYMPYETDDYATRPAAMCNGGGLLNMRLHVQRKPNPI